MTELAGRLVHVRDGIYRIVDEKCRDAVSRDRARLLRWLVEHHLDEFLSDFLPQLYIAWNRASPDVKSKYAYNMALLLADSNTPNSRHAKYNAFIAYCVYRGYITTYEAVQKYRLVSGGESIYTWLRMYRELIR